MLTATAQHTLHTPSYCRGISAGGRRCYSHNANPITGYCDLHAPPLPSAENQASAAAILKAHMAVMPLRNHVLYMIPEEDCSEELLIPVEAELRHHLKMLHTFSRMYNLLREAGFSARADGNLFMQLWEELYGAVADLQAYVQSIRSHLTNDWSSSEE